MVSLTADTCLDEADKASEIGCGRLAADSIGVETDRYGVQERPSKKGRGFQARTRENVPEMAHSRGGGTAGDPVMQDDSRQRCGHHGVHRSARRYRTHEGRLGGWSVLADRGYDSDSNDKAIFDLGMHPNIKQKANAKNRGRPSRRRAAREFDPDLYKRRGMVEAIFGAAAETADHRLYCRYRTTETQARFGPTLAICMNVETLNRIRCAVDLGHPLTVA